MSSPGYPDGPFTLADAAQVGFKRHQVHLAVRDGALRRVLRGVFVRFETPDSVELRAAAAALVVGPTAVITDRTAAWIHGIDVLTYGEHDVLPPIESCVLRRRSRSRREGVDGRTRDLADADVMVIGGVRVTTPLRTALDLGCHLRRKDALAALDQFVRVHGLTREELTREAGRYFRRRGVVQLRQLIPLVDGRAESPRESWTRLLIIDAGLPCPEPQYWIEIDGVPTYRLDLAYPRLRVVIEYDGEEFHDRTDAQRRHDAERREWLDEHGWTIVLVKKGDFTGANLDRWLNELRGALRPSYSNRRW
ncbi:MAG TPA: DUF559 domain-containing protein [Marmoricola sp.]|nr:DUF559 domain-containing protein [Marmoricola sp.]